MSNTHKSDSYMQIKAEESIFLQVEHILGLSLEKCPKKYFPGKPRTYIQPDFFSEKECILGEIFAHIGKPKKAQDNKIANDILKMLTYEKTTGISYRKILVVCDQEEFIKLQGESVLAESIRQHQIELMCVEIEDVLRQKLIETQKRQKMVNE